MIPTVDYYSIEQTDKKDNRPLLSEFLCSFLALLYLSIIQKDDFYQLEHESHTNYYYTPIYHSYFENHKPKVGPATYLYSDHSTL